MPAADDALAALTSMHRDLGCDCIVTRCHSTSSKCTLVISQANVICISIDNCKAFQMAPGKRADFLILQADHTGRPWRWCVVEMKSQVEKPKAVVTQLQETISVVEDHPSFQILDFPPVLLPLVLYSKAIREIDAGSVLGGKTIRLRTDRFPILVRKCGVRLDALGTATLGRQR